MSSKRLACTTGTNNELDVVEKMLADSKIQQFGLSRDHGSRVDLQSVAPQSQNSKDSKEEKEDMPELEVTGEFESLHIETSAERMEILKQGIDECQVKCDIINRRESLL
jgi:Spy/CpxP family protein refolding chaperone